MSNETGMSATLASEIESNWDRLVQFVVNGNGIMIRDHLRDIRKDNRPLFNALYWRADGWMMDYLMRRPMTTSETEKNYDKKDAGQARLAAILYGKLGSGWWGAKDLPWLMMEIRRDVAGD